MAGKMMLHCGAHAVSRDQVRAVPVPLATRTWRPVAYDRAIEFVHDQAAQLGRKVVGEGYGLSHNGQQLFGLLSLDAGNSESALSIGIRQSYDKSLALGIAIGLQVFVCDNLVFSASAFCVLRKNTINVWDDFRSLVQKQIAKAPELYQATVASLNKLKEIPCTETQGFAALGVALGRELLTTTQVNRALRFWRESETATAREALAQRRSLWGLYNATTEGLKKGTVSDLLSRHHAAHEYLTQELPELPAFKV